MGKYRDEITYSYAQNTIAHFTYFYSPKKSAPLCR
jgi:hypothetical protein